MVRRWVARGAGEERGSRGTGRRGRGQSLVEFAIILPVFLILIGGALDLGRVFYANISLHNAAREGAMQAAVTPDSYRPNQACDPVTNNVTCRVLFEVEDSWTTISPSDIDLDCSQTGCPAGPGSTVTVSVQGRFQLLTPLLASVFGGDELDLSSSATALIEYLPPAPVGGAPARPVADFSATPRSGDEPLEVTFTDLSGPAISGWLWSFGDGGSSTEQNPTYRYETPGTYSVTLQVVNLSGQNTLAKADYIEVTGAGPTPTPDPDPSPSPSPSCQYPPDVIGMSPGTADLTLGQAGFWPDGYGDLTTGTKNRVQAQNPDHTQCIAPGSTISYHYRPQN